MGESVNSIKRESIFIGILEGVHPEDAKIIIAMINKQNIIGLSRPVVEEAFPNLLQDQKGKVCYNNLSVYKKIPVNQKFMH